MKPSDTALYTFWGMAGAALPAVFLYLFVGLAWKGKTLGAAVMQIMAIRSDGRPLGAGGAMARVVGLLVYPLVLAIGGGVGYAVDGTGPITAIAVGVIERVQHEGVCWAGRTVWRGQVAMRISICNWSTTERDIQESAEAIIRAARTVREHIL